jgi:tripartite-type tricarboxylate transporter receptor subunit TctC
MKDYASPFIVENRPGASERIALEAVKSSAADGSVPGQVKTLADFIAWCRANPKQATYGTVGAGSLHHFIGVALARTAGFEFVQVPYQGLAAVQDLLAGRIAATIFPPSPSLPYIQSGELRALMTTGTKRSASFPDVPTARELRYPVIEEDDWFGIFVPARTPAETVKTLNTAIRAALKTDDVKAGLAKLSLEPSGDSPEELARQVKYEFDRWGPIVEASGFRADN